MYPTARKKQQADERDAGVVLVMAELTSLSRPQFTFMRVCRL
jgi:hypothetical protein